SFPVGQDKQLLGILTLEDLKKLPREQWRNRRVRDAMRPVTPSMFVKTSADMDVANELIQSNGIGAVAVIEESGELVGFLRRGRVRRKKK
ncbi:MAG TPA: CBS domain-containing protein, partial [Pyrinomonadaceae bacterium]